MSDRSTALILTFILALLLAGCQSVSDLQPQPDVLPPSVVDVLETEFPGYKEITVSPLEKDKVWSARLRVDTSRYDVVLNRTKILAKYRLTENKIPTVFAAGVATLNIKGGIFSDSKTAPDYDNDYRTWNFLASYTWNNQDYLMQWRKSYYGPPSRYDIYLYPHGETVYRTTTLEDLSDTVQEIVRKKMLAVNNPSYTEDQEFRMAWVYSDKNKKKDYEVTLSYSTILIDEEGRILYYFPINLANSVQRENLPEPIRTYLLQDPNAARYTRFASDKYAENGNEIYRVSLSQDVQNYTLYFDKNGLVLWQFYMAYPEF